MECGDHWLLYAQVDHGGCSIQSPSPPCTNAASGANSGISNTDHSDQHLPVPQKQHLHQGLRIFRPARRAFLRKLDWLGAARFPPSYPHYDPAWLRLLFRCGCQRRPRSPPAVAYGCNPHRGTWRSFTRDGWRASSATAISMGQRRDVAARPRCNAWCRPSGVVSHARSTAAPMPCRLFADLDGTVQPRQARRPTRAEAFALGATTGTLLLDPEGPRGRCALTGPLRLVGPGPCGAGSGWACPGGLAAQAGCQADQMAACGSIPGAPGAWRDASASLGVLKGPSSAKRRLTKPRAAGARSASCSER